MPQLLRRNLSIPNVAGLPERCHVASGLLVGNPLGEPALRDPVGGLPTHPLQSTPVST